MVVTLKGSEWRFWLDGVRMVDGGWWIVPNRRANVEKLLNERFCGPFVGKLNTCRREI